MKNSTLLISVFTLITFCTLGYAQQNLLFSVSGKVQDSLSHVPLKYITISLLSDKSKYQKKTITNDQGEFTIAEVPKGEYRITISSLGFSEKKIDLKLEEVTTVSLGTIYLHEGNIQLNDVVIKIAKPLIIQDIDRIIYDAQADPDSKSRQAIDIISKVPLLSIGADGKLQLRGGGNFKVLLNGRTSSMTEHNLESFLKSLPANALAKIEVITTPPAKYESEGLEGIINIVLNRRVSDGYNGSSQISYNTIGGPRSTATLTLKEKKLIVFGSLLYSKQDPIESTSYNSRMTVSGISRSQLFNNELNSWSGNYFSSADELSYELDSLNLITATFGFNRLRKEQEGNQLLSMFDDGIPSYSYLLSNNQDSKLKGFDLGMNYQKTFRNSKDRILTASYKRIESRNLENNLNDVSSISNYYGEDFSQSNRYGSVEQSFQVDYTHPWGKRINFEGGGKIILRDNYSDFNTISFTSNREPSNSSSNIFDHEQDIYALYNSWQIKRKKWGMRAGVRLERTAANGNFASTNNTVNKSYTNLIPSVSIQRKLPNRNSLTLGYTQRIQRPGIVQLNPFVNKINSLNYQFGNPDLAAVLNHNLELNFSSYKKASVYLGLNYSFANNTIQNVITLSTDSVSLSTFENIGKNQSFGTNIYFKYPLAKNIGFELNGRVSQVYAEGLVRGISYINEGIQGNASSEFSFDFPADFRSSLEVIYHSPRIILQGKTNYYVNTTVSIVKDLLKRKATLTLFVRNPFQKFLTNTSYLNTSNFIQESSKKNYFRGADILFVYRFGRLKDQVKKNKRGIINDDKL